MREYQFGFSEAHHAEMYDIEGRRRKADKIISVLEDYFQGSLHNLILLDVGCSTGVISQKLSHRFRTVVGIDIDEPAVEFARKNSEAGNLHFAVQDSMNLGFPDEAFDVVVCAHVYEHVPDPRRLMSEINRVLKPGGICYFAAGNRLNIVEGHYKLPFLSVIPKPLAHLYLRILRRGSFYYENHFTLWGLRRLVSGFEIIDYTNKIIRDPERYFATDMIKRGSLKQKVSLMLLKVAYWLCPTYIWLLRKRAA